jgi:hypothetical protein
MRQRELLQGNVRVETIRALSCKDGKEQGEPLRLIGAEEGQTRRKKLQRK